MINKISQNEKKSKTWKKKIFLKFSPLRTLLFFKDQQTVSEMFHNFQKFFKLY